MLARIMTKCCTKEFRPPKKEATKLSFFTPKKEHLLILRKYHVLPYELSIISS